MARRVTGAVAAGMVVVVAVATPAMAHHPVIAGQVECAENDQQIITWTVTHETLDNRSMVIKAIGLSRGTLVGISVGQTLPPPPASGSTVTGTSTFPGDSTGTVTLAVTGRWVDENGEPSGPQSRTRSATVDLIGTCVPSTTTTTSTTSTSTTSTSTTSTSTTSTSTTSTSTTSTTTTTTPATTTTSAPSERTQVAGVLVERPAAAPAAVAAAPAAEAPAPAPRVAAAAAAAPPELPRTGTGAMTLMGIGVVLVGFGTLLTRAGRRGRHVTFRI